MDMLPQMPSKHNAFEVTQLKYIVSIYSLLNERYLFKIHLESFKRFS